MVRCCLITAFPTNLIEIVLHEMFEGVLTLAPVSLLQLFAGLLMALVEGLLETSSVGGD